MRKLFNWFRSPPPEPISGLNNEDFLKAVLELISTQQPGGWTMIAVGIAAKVQAVAIFRKELERKGIDIKKLRKKDKTLILEIPTMIQLYWEEMEKSPEDSTLYLRSFWLYLGALACSATERAETDSISENYLREIWLCLIRGSLIAPSVLKKNILWNDEEKNDLLMKGESGRMVAMVFKHNPYFPKKFRYSDEIDKVIEKGPEAVMAMSPNEFQRSRW